ncbi:MAG: SHOCT domain-containing protein [Desulfobacterales bacterium]|nr:SHOCT domain-containing protein [Desulfobacterales bacterium]
MKLKIYSAITACIFLFATGSALAQENQGEVHFCNALFVSNAEGMAFDGHILTMKGIDRTITYFCDRPVRFAGQMPLEEVRELVSKGDNNFNDIPPNAALSIFDKGGKITTVVLHLYEKPIVKENEIKYPVKVLLGKLPKTGGASTMFIDVVGAPVTPGSVAGAKRRTRRRTAAVVTSASKTTTQQQQQQTQQQQTPSPAATATESIEDRLRTLDKLAAGGYITKQEYEARKKSILDSL